MANASGLQANWQAGVIDLGPGHPSDDLLPLALMRSAAAARLARPDPSLLQYGAEQGDERLRRLLAAAFTADPGSPADPERLFVTSGASQALDVLCTLWARPGDVVVVPEPTYFLALEVFRDHGLAVLPVACDAEGPLPGALRSALAASKAALLYLVPAFANPTGVTLSPSRQAQVVSLAAEHGTLLIADEVYRQLAFEGDPPSSLAAPGRERVVSLGSFSKILAPGLRLGWMAGPTGILERVRVSGLLRSGGGLNPFTGALVAELLESGELLAHVAGLRRTYAERAAALAEALRREAPELAFDDPRGGYFIWARLPGEDASLLREHARAAGTDFAPGALFSPHGELADHLRLAFSHYSPNELREAAARLGRAVRSLLRARHVSAPVGSNP